MKNISQLIFMLFIVIFSIPIAFSESEKFEFKFEVDHNFDDDNQIKCEIEYDDNSKDFRFDEDDSGNDLIFEKSFIEKVDFNCDEDIDDITLQVYDQAGKKLYDEDYSNENRVKFDIDDYRYDEDEDWFSIDLNHNFGSEEIDCELELDGTDYDFTFDSDDSSSVLKIEKNFDTIIKFSCDDDIDEITLTVFDDNGNEEYDETFKEDDRISYDKDKEDLDSTEVIIDIDHDFGSDKIKCDLEIDSDDYATYSFDEDSSSSDLKVAVDIKEEIVFDCNDKFDEIVVRIYNDDGEKIDTLEYDNEDEFEYEVSGGDYDWNFRIINEFDGDEEIECVLTVDSKKILDVELDSSSKISDLLHDGNFESKINFLCDGNLDKIEFSTYIDGKSTPIFEEIFENELSFDYVQLNVAEQKIVDDEKLEVAAEEKRRVLAEEAALIEVNKLKAAEQKIAEQKAEVGRVAAEKERLEKIELDKQDDLNSQNKKENLTGLSGQVVAEDLSELGVNAEADYGVYYMILAGVSVILLIGAFFSFVDVRSTPSRKSSSKSTSHSFKHEPSRRNEQKTSTNSRNRDKIDFDFLNKRK